MNNVRYWRTYYDYSQRKLAMKAKISSVELSYIESGKRIPKVDIAIKLANSLNVPVEELFDSDGK